VGKKKSSEKYIEIPKKKTAHLGRTHEHPV